MRRLTFFLPISLVAGICLATWHVATTPQVGHKSNQGLLVATGQYLNPAGQMVVTNSRPVDIAVSRDGRFAYLKDGNGVTVVDCNSMTVVSQVKVDGSDSYCGLALSDDGRTLCYTTASQYLYVYNVDGPTITVRKKITLPKARVGGGCNACGIAYQDPSHVFVCLNRDNSVARVDLESGTIEKWDVNVAPFGIAYDAQSQRLFISCWSRKAEGNERQAATSGTEVPVDERGVGLGGRLTVFDLRRKQIAASLEIGHHASEVNVFEGSVYIPCSGSDEVEQVSISDLSHRTLKPFPNQPIGAAPASVVFSPDGNTEFVTCSGRNSVVALNRTTGRPIGEFPTAWYPVATRLRNGKLFVACTKGIGELTPEKNPNSHNSWDLTGALCVIDASTTLHPMPYTPEPVARKRVTPVPLPERAGEPSLFKHVVYVIRENRTYDQILGDMKEGDGDPSLCNFGEKVTPNAHALAREYTLLDNYYCSGICSADGHSWATEGNATSNLERATSAWPRSYPFGDDALNNSSTGFLWDSAIEAGKSFMNFGEFDYASTAGGKTYFDCLKEHNAGTNHIKFKQNIGVERTRRFSVPGFPGWDLSIPDVLRADIFLRRLKQMESAGSMPDFTILYLCCDHTGGPVTARAQVADNDLALGMCIDGLTKSKFWKDTCIFVEEDDSQAGWDHVNGHRSPCLVISPYSRGLGRIDDFYNQTSVYRSIEHILGLKTKSRFVSISPLMFACFGKRLDLAPYRARRNQVPLDETSGKRYGRNFDLSKPDQVDDAKFNRAIWADSMPGKPYPAEFEGAHGKGLATRGLTSLDVQPDRD